MFFQDWQRDKEESGRQLAEAKALSQQLAAMSRRELERSHEQATLLGLEALKAADTLEAREALIHAARYAWPSAVLADASQLGGSPVAVALSNDGQQLGIVARNGADSSVSLWDVQDADARKPKRLWRTKVATEASSLVFARDKSRIAVGGALGVELLDTKLGERELMLPESGPVKALAFGGKGQVVWSTERRLHVWGRDPVSQTTEHIDIAGVEEISLDSRGASWRSADCRMGRWRPRWLSQRPTGPGERNGCLSIAEPSDRRRLAGRATPRSSRTQAADSRSMPTALLCLMTNLPPPTRGSPSLSRMWSGRALAQLT